MDTGLMTSSDEDAVLATPLPTAAPRNARRNLAAQQQYIEQQTVAEWMSTIQFEGDIKLKIFRTEPQHWRNSQGTQSRIAGFLREYERPITEIDVQQEFGGGAYVISAWGKDNKAIGKAVSISIAGDPLVPLSALPAAAPRKDDDVSKALVTAVTQMSEKRSEELREALQNRKQDEAASTALFVEQLRMVEQEKARLAQIIEAQNVRLQEAMLPKANPQQDRMYELTMQNMMNTTTTTTQRYESELRDLRGQFAAREAYLQNAADQRLQDLRADMTRQLDNLKAASDRELQMTRATLEGQLEFVKQNSTRSVEDLKMMSEMRNISDRTALTTEITLLKSRTSELESQLAAKDAELVSLRAKKEQSFGDKLKEIDAMKSLITGGDAPAEESVLARIMGSDMVKGIAGKLLTSAMDTQQQAVDPTPPPTPRLPAPQPARPNRTRPRPGPVQKATAATAEAPKPLEVQVTPAPEPVPSPAPPTSAEIETAVAFCQSAFNENKNPDEFASSVKSMIPQTILDEIRNKGTLDFLKAHGKEATFQTQAAKNWIRRVGYALSR
mgnify:CR=1 FL=1